MESKGYGYRARRGQVRVKVSVERAVRLWNDTTVLLVKDARRSTSSMKALFSDLTPVDLSGSVLTLSTPNHFTKRWVEMQLSDDIHQAVLAACGESYAVHIIVSDDSVPKAPPEVSSKTAEYTALSFAGSDSDVAHEVPDGTLDAASEVAVFEPGLAGYTLEARQQAVLPAVLTGSAVSVAEVDDSFDQRMTFESFVYGENNQLAYSTAVQVARAPGYVYNPLFIYGKSGLGKTHLLLAIRHYIQQHRPELKIVYAQTNEMLAEYSYAAMEGDFRAFNQKYTTADVFLLDDVQRLEKLQSTVNIVFDIFNQMTDENKQIVLSSDRPPREIALEERYLSRFGSGVTADVQPPSFETKLIIVNNYLPYCCRRFGCENVLGLINQDVIEHIVSLSGSNIRELKGAVNNLVNSIKHDTSRYLPLTSEEAESIVSNHFRHLDARQIDLDAVFKAVEKYFNVRHDDLISQKRSQDISHPRQIAMYLARLLTGSSLLQVAHAFKKDHSAVIYAVRSIDKKRQTSTTVENEVIHLLEVLTGQS